MKRTDWLLCLANNLKQLFLELKFFPQETMAAGENRFAPELNEKEVIRVLENGTPGSIKNATNYGIKIFQGKNFKTLF